MTSHHKITFVNNIFYGKYNHFYTSFLKLWNYITVINCFLLISIPAYLYGNSNIIRKSCQDNGCVKNVRFLKKNIPITKQLNQENTIYVVKYNYEVDGVIKIPDNSTLYFEKGTIQGDVIIKGNSFSIVGKGKYVGSIRGIQSHVFFKCCSCKFKYFSSDSKYFIDCRGSCDIRENEFVGFKSNVINLEKCQGECVISNNYIHDNNLSGAIDNERRAIHILHCGNVLIKNNVIDKYIGCGIGFLTGYDTESLYKSVLVLNNVIKNTRLGGITSMGNSSGNLYNAVIKGNVLLNINSGELNDHSALSAVINIHGGVNCTIEENIIKGCQGLGLDIEGFQRINNSYVIRNNIFDGCRRLNFNLCDDILFDGNKVSNIIPNPAKPGAIRIRKTLRFKMTNNDINDEDANEPTIQFDRNEDRPAQLVKTFFLCKDNVFNVGNKVNTIYDINCEMTIGANDIVVKGKREKGKWQSDLKYPDNIRYLDENRNTE